MYLKYHRKGGENDNIIDCLVEVKLWKSHLAVRWRVGVRICRMVKDIKDWKGG